MNDPQGGDGAWRDTLEREVRELRSRVAELTGRIAGGRPKETTEIERVLTFLEESQRVASTGSWMLDLESGAFTASGPLRELLQLDPSGETKADDILARVRADDLGCVRRMWERVRSGFNVPSTLARIETNGPTREVQFDAKIIGDERGRKIALGTVKDVTVERELRRRARDWDRLEAVSRVVAGMTHDLNNLLQIVLMEARTIQTRSTSLSGARETARHILAATEQASELLRQIDDLALHESQEDEPICLAQLARRTLEMLRSSAPRADEFGVRAHEEGVWVRGDYSGLSRVVVNLVLNAHAAISDGGSIRVVVATKEITEPGKIGLPPGTYAVLAVSDDGVGMPPELIDRAFEPFFSTRGSSGLGLPTAYGIVARHGGMIEVESSAGEGSTFHVYLPLMRSDEPGDGATESHSSQTR